MFSKRQLSGLILVSGLAIGVLMPVSASAAGTSLSCRSSAIRLGLPLGVNVEPVVANAPDAPCATDTQAVVSFTHVLGISTGTITANTNADKAPMLSRAKIEGLSLANVLGALNLSAKAVRAEAKIVGRDSGNCKLRSSSTLVGLSVLGQDFASLDTPMDFDVKLLGIVVAKLHLNATIGGAHPTIGKPDPTQVTQRAVWLHVTDPLLQGTLVDLIAGEATAAANGKKACA